MKFHALAYCAILFPSLLWADAAFAQRTYTCRQGGSVTISDRPCSDGSSSSTSSNSGSGFVYYGPSQQEQQQTTNRVYSRRNSSDAPEHQQYMSGRCAAMNDELRNGHSKGLSYQTMSELQKNYGRECGEDDRQARTQLYAAKRANAIAQMENQNQANADKQNSALKQQQCDESKRILHAKSSRTDLNEGERAELARFKENYQARCQ